MGRYEIDSAEWWAEHGVAPDVRDARPYGRWTRDDIEPVREAYQGLTQGQLRTLVRWARQSDGLVIYRHSFQDAALGDGHRVYPEIRPDDAICTETVWHYHGPPTDEPPRHPSSGKPLRPEHIHSAESMEKHIARNQAPDDHSGVNNSQVHSHRAMAKYLFPPRASGLVGWIDHHRKAYEAKVLRHLPLVSPHGGVADPSRMMPRAEYERLEREFDDYMTAHLGRNHDGQDVEGYHVHTFSAKTRGEQLAKRIDVNPLVWERGGFAGAERAWFGIEGCIKADAILTALLQAGEPPAVFSVPSVSLWEATYPAEETDLEEGDELAAFAVQYLLGKVVCIVPDADAYANDEVMTQALLCRSMLRRLGARAEIVLPPDERLDEGIKGVDDYLGRGGGTLDNMVWYQKEPPNEQELTEWLLRRPEAASWRADRRRRAAETLEALATHAGENGEYSASLRLLSRAIGRRSGKPETWQDDIEAVEAARARDPEAARKRFERGVRDLLEVGAISSNKPLSIRQERWVRQQSGWHLDQGLNWAEDAIVITVREALRASAKRRSVNQL